MPTKQIRYRLAIEVELVLKNDAVVANNGESVAAAVRYYLRQLLPARYTPGGYQFLKESIHVEAKEVKE